jgi:hypothetical protein
MEKSLKIEPIDVYSLKEMDSYLTREKIKQTQQNNHLNLPAYIVVVEFSLPKLQVTKR